MRSSLATSTVLTGLTCLFVTGVTTQSPLTSLPLALSPDSEFNFQLLINLGSIPYAAANVLSAARVIKPGSFESFNTTFYELAAETQALAEGYGSRNPVNPQDTYFAASAYWRSADFFLHANWSDPLINSYWVGQTECFNKAIAALPVPGQRVTLPSEGFDTIGIYYAVDTSETKRPTMIIVQGYDAAQEDSYMQVGAAAVARGWNVLTVEGPGQPTVRRDQGLGFIYQYERVVTPAVDYLANKSDVDMSRLALFGISLGGYLASRAAAYEPRIKALVLDDGIWDLQQSLTNGFPPQLLDLYTSGNQTAFNDIIFSAIVNNASAPSSARWGIDQGLWSFKTHSPYELIQLAASYVFEPLADLIKIPVFVGSGVDDTDFPGQAPKVAAALGSRATLYNFTGPAAYHAQAGAFQTANLVYFGWLEQVFGLQPQDTEVYAAGPVSQISGCQPTATAVSQISDGQPQAPTTTPVSEMSDGQPYATMSM